PARFLAEKPPSRPRSELKGVLLLAWEATGRPRKAITQSLEAEKGKSFQIRGRNINMSIWFLRLCSHFTKGVRAQFVSPDFSWCVCLFFSLPIVVRAEFVNPDFSWCGSSS